MATGPIFPTCHFVPTSQALRFRYHACHVQAVFNLLLMTLKNRQEGACNDKHFHSAYSKHLTSSTNLHTVPLPFNTMGPFVFESGFMSSQVWPRPSLTSAAREVLSMLLKGWEPRKVVLLLSFLLAAAHATLVAPSITNLSPTSGAVSAVVTIAGSNFGPTQGPGKPYRRGTGS